MPVYNSSTTMKVKSAAEIQELLDSRVVCPKCGRKVLKLFKPSNLCRKCLLEKRRTRK